MNRLLLAPFTLAITLSGCAGVSALPDVGPPQSRLLTQAQALLVIQETLAHQGSAAEQKWPVLVDDRSELVVDVRVGSDPFAIEWVSEEDRIAHAAVLPEATPDGPLHIITARSPEAPSAQVLVLDAQAYGYEGNPRLVQRGAPGIAEAEAEIRRDVQEFLDYARSQAAR